MSDELTLEQAQAIYESFRGRREVRPEEDEMTAFLVVLLNHGDHMTAVTCVAGEWSGQKADLQPRVGVPVCPQGHPLLEHGPMMRLGFVEMAVPS